MGRVRTRSAPSGRPSRRATDCPPPTIRVLGAGSASSGVSIKRSARTADSVCCQMGFRSVLMGVVSG
eukprot:4293891-Alexandrium_andersonii.AAC.1